MPARSSRLQKLSANPRQPPPEAADALSSLHLTDPPPCKSYPDRASRDRRGSDSGGLTGALVLLNLLAIGCAAFALGKRFRVYSFATLLVIIAFGALSGPYGARLAAGQPTPGFGIVERILIYMSLLWVAVFAIALVRSLRNA